jgi:hypothetical protein
LISLLSNWRPGPKPQESEIFPYHEEFKKLLLSIENMTKSLTTVSVSMRKTSKISITVFEPPSDQLPILDMCRRQWFNIGKVPMSRSQMSSHWLSVVTKYKFIDPTPGIIGMRNTCKNLNCSVMELKGFLEGMNLRARDIQLQDTEAKGKDIVHVLTRIYWPNKQIRYVKDDSDLEAKILRSQLLSISTYWQVQSYLSHMSREVIKDSKVLTQSMSALPNSLKKIKIMHDFLVSGDKDLCIRRIEFLKIGVLGFFSKRQGGYGTTRIGEGIWRGKICGSDCEISMEKNVCTRIRVKFISDSRSFGINLANLLSEFGLSNGLECKSDLYLSAGGRMSTTDMNYKNFRIWIDADMESMILSDLMSLEWDVELALNQNLRLVVYDSKSSRVEKLTILSDSLTSRDWLPGHSISLSDHVLDRWAKGISCPTTVLEDFTLHKFPLSRSDFSRRSWKRPETTHPWDYNKFKSQLIQYMNPKFKPIKKDSDEPSSEDLPDFDSFRSMITMTSLNYDVTSIVQEALESWADILEEEDSTQLPVISDIDESRISHLVKMFQGVEDEHEIFVDDIDMRRTMPSAQQFFSSLESLCQTQCGCNMKDLVTKLSDQVNPKVNGLMGKIMSIILDRWVYDSELEGMQDASRWESESIALSDSLIAEEDLMNVPDELLEINIKSLENEMSESSGVVLASLTSTLNRYLRVKMMRQERLERRESQVMLRDDYLISKVYELLDRLLIDPDEYPKSQKHWPLIFSDSLAQFVSSLVENKSMSILESQRFNVSLLLANVTPKLRELVEMYTDHKFKNDPLHKNLDIT